MFDGSCRERSEAVLLPEAFTPDWNEVRESYRLRCGLISEVVTVCSSQGSPGHTFLMSIPFMRLHVAVESVKNKNIKPEKQQHDIPTKAHESFSEGKTMRAPIMMNPAVQHRANNKQVVGHPNNQWPYCYENISVIRISTMMQIYL
mmetsp:Transcript_30188/g.97148  ORF Transcript_30188/g.97148 Transcript_30188/m.97148 type:complete len:146 (-) Transcript_30188:1270-1707(-)